nr:ribonuclease H-like domain-containing protein [Tanacetum cinerariifolium]
MRTSKHVSCLVIWFMFGYSARKGFINITARLVAQRHTQEEGIDYDEVFAPIARIEAISLYLAYASFKDFVVYQMDVKSAFLYGKIEEEVYVYQPPGFEDPNFLDKVYKVEKALYGLHQPPRAWPNITFAVCAYARFQVTLKTSHLHVVKRIFRYLKGQPKLGLWYPTDSPFDLEAYTDSDYAGASLDWKSTTGAKDGICFVDTSKVTTGNILLTARLTTAGQRLMLPSIKLQLLVLVNAAQVEFDQIIDFLQSKPIHYALTVNLTIYVSCVKQFWATTKVKSVNNQEQIQDVVDKKKVIITKDSIRSDLYFDDAEGTTCLLYEAIFKGLACMGYEKPSQKLTFYNAYSPQWKFLIHTILQCLGAKTTAWNEFSSTVASAIIYNQVEGMARHKEMYVISSHTKKIFANMRRIEAGFSGVVTPLFENIMVQAAVDMGDTPVETHQTPIVDQPYTYRPQKKQKPRRKQRNEAEVSHDKSEDDDHAPIIHFLVRKSRSGGLRRLMKIGSGRRVKSPLEKDSLGAQEDASKQGRMIEEIDQDDKIALDADTQGRNNDDEMFGVDDLSGEEIVLDTITGEHEEQIIKDVSTAEPVNTSGEVVTTVADKVSAALTTDVTEDEITMAQALASLKSTKPKVVVQEEKQSHIPTVSSSKDKGKAKMIEPEVPIKKKDQMRIDEEYARQLEAEEQEAARLSKAQQDEEVNISCDNTQPMMEADNLLAERLQAREREEFSEVQKARLLVELIEKRHFAALRAQKKRNKPPTKARMRGQMFTYLRNMGGYKHFHLKGRSYDEIKKLFDKEMRKVNNFIAMNLEAQKSIGKEAQESSTKRTAKSLESDISKKQKVDENVKPIIDDTEELKKCMEIVVDDGNKVLIEATPISSRSPTIIDYKIRKKGKKNYFKIIRADGNSQVYQTFEKILRTSIEKIWKFCGL